MACLGREQHQTAVRRTLHRADAPLATIMLWHPHAGQSSTGGGPLGPASEQFGFAKSS